MDDNEDHKLHLEDSARLASMSPKSDYEKHLEEKRRIMESRKQNMPKFHDRIKEKDSDSSFNIKDDSLQSKNPQKNFNREPQDFDESIPSFDETMESDAIVEISHALDTDTHLLLEESGSRNSGILPFVIYVLRLQYCQVLRGSCYLFLNSCLNGFASTVVSLIQQVEFSSGFLIPMILVKVFPTTLRPTAVYLFFTTLVCSLFSSNVAAWLDVQPRRTGFTL